MKRMIAAAGLLLGLALFLAACGLQEPQKTIFRELGIDVSQGTVAADFDSHGGPHGDGSAYAALQFSDTRALEQIEKSDQWRKLPLEKTVQALVYGIEEGTSQIGPFLTDEKGDPLVPEIREGYYLLIDRQAEPGKATGADILHRGSFNFTLGLYDTEAQTLYYCKLDS